MHKLLILLLLSGCAMAQGSITGQGAITGNGTLTAPTSSIANCSNPGIHCLTDCTQPTVSNAIASAVEGDTIILPVCNVAWTAGIVFLHKHVNFIGQGETQTIITDNIDKSGSPCTYRGNSLPLIQIDDSTYVNSQGSILVPSSYPTMTSPMRVSGFTVVEGLHLPDNSSAICSHFDILSGSHQLRVDHVTLSNLCRRCGGYFTDGDIWGVWDHDTITGVAQEPIAIHTMMWQASGNYGDNSWAQPSTYGTVQQLTIEDSVLKSNASVWCEYGSRCAIRHTQLGSMVTHGTDSLGRYRSGRFMEVYRNTFICDSTVQVGGTVGVPFLHSFRGGTIIFWENNILRDGSTNCTLIPNQIQFNANYYRIWSRFYPWGPQASIVTGSYRGACDGTGLFDQNQPRVATGTAGTGSGKDVLVDPTANWTTNQWAGYMLHNVTGNQAPPLNNAGVACSGNGGPPSGGQYGTSTGPFGQVIASNTATTITAEAGSFDCTQGGYSFWVPGDTYEIYPLGKCMDNVGYGQGARLDNGYNGLIFTCSAGGNGLGCATPNANQCQSTGPCGWANQQTDPLYSWSNIITNSVTNAVTPFVGPYGIGIEFGSLNPAIKFNREIYNENDSFTGASTVGCPTTGACDGGVGIGTLAARPATCTPEVGWWATDTQTLYTCALPPAAANTWVVHYQPLTYPHPFATAALMSRDGHLIETADGQVQIRLKERPERPGRQRPGRHPVVRRRRKEKREERREERKEERREDRREDRDRGIYDFPH